MRNEYLKKIITLIARLQTTRLNEEKIQILDRLRASKRRNVIVSVDRVALTFQVKNRLLKTTVAYEKL